MVGLHGRGFFRGRRPGGAETPKIRFSAKTVAELGIIESIPKARRKLDQHIRLFLFERAKTLHEIKPDLKVISDLRGSFERRNKSLTMEERLSALSELAEMEGILAAKCVYLADEADYILKKAGDQKFGQRKWFEIQRSAYEREVQALEESKEQHEAQAGKLRKAIRRDEIRRSN